MDKPEQGPGFYVDLEFEYKGEWGSIAFSVHIGNTLEEGYQTYQFIWKHNISNPGMRSISLRWVPNEDPELFPVSLILSKRTTLAKRTTLSEEGD